MASDDPTRRPRGSRIAQLSTLIFSFCLVLSLFISRLTAESARHLIPVPCDVSPPLPSAMNFPSFYLIENATHGFVGIVGTANSKDPDALSVVKAVPKDSRHFYITQESNGTFVIRSLAGRFTGKASGYTKREIAVIHHNEIVSFPDDNKHLHRWKLVRDVADPTHFYILDVATMAYWRLSSGQAGTKVDLYYPIPEFLQNVPRADAATTIPPGIAWILTPVLLSGRYHIKNLLYGDINVGTKDNDGNTPVVAASSPALWDISFDISFTRTPRRHHSPEEPHPADGATWNIFFFFVKPKSKSTATISASKAAADSNDDDDDANLDDDEEESPVAVVKNTVVITEEVAFSRLTNFGWAPVWSAKDGAWRIVGIKGSGFEFYEWSLADKYHSDKSDQAHVLCSQNANGCFLWEIIRVSD
ncbi:hypothetical protein Hypma_009508 [Hypsizygus marmoreus]|uniref:Uncharacterized protein n=1 Tax=Hypsizygus marmoreus TaxID=39966 RepID=A0A369JY08_HYPMA|nr:hypothetical protein Hypma_009508 [Hypsizygus marmoreus]